MLKSFIEELKLKNSIRSLKGKPHHNWILNLPTLALQWTGVFSLNSDSRVANVCMSVGQSICHKNLYDLRYQPSWLSVIPPISHHGYLSSCLPCSAILAANHNCLCYGVNEGMKWNQEICNIIRCLFVIYVVSEICLTNIFDQCLEICDTNKVPV